MQQFIYRFRKDKEHIRDVMRFWEISQEKCGKETFESTA
jgi:hypothetical protein